MKTLEERFWAKVDKSGECWAWTGSKFPSGYGQIFVGGRRDTKPAHRVSYEMVVGPIPEGHEIDHRCHNKSCVNPDHLRPVTRKQNRENLAGAFSNSKSGVRGVTWDRTRGKYLVTVTHDYKKRYVGRYTTLAEAESVAIAARNELFTHNDRDRKNDG